MTLDADDRRDARTIRKWPPRTPQRRREQRRQPQHARALGLKLAPLTSDWRQRLHVGKGVKGVVVTGVADNSPFADVGLQPGDVIEPIDQQPVTTPQGGGEEARRRARRQGQQERAAAASTATATMPVCRAVDGQGEDNG